MPNIYKALVIEHLDTVITLIYFGNTINTINISVCVYICECVYWQVYINVYVYGCLYVIFPCYDCSVMIILIFILIFVV